MTGIATYTRPAPGSGRRRILGAYRRLLVGGMVAACTLAIVGGTGFGASSDSETVSLWVDGTISITEPTGLDNSPSPSSGVIYLAGTPGTLKLGALKGQQQATGSLTYRITTNHPIGYVVILSNGRSGGSVLQSATGASFPDMGDTPGTINSTVSSFGVSIGDAATHAQGSVGLVSGSPWGTTGGTQGTLFRGVPSAGMVIATRSSGIDSDPFTINVAANLSTAQPLTAGSYTGTMNITASTL